MDFSTLEPLKERLVEQVSLLHNQALGRRLKLHTKDNFPDLETIKLAIISVGEYRNSDRHIGQHNSFDEVRTAFYSLFPGNWTFDIADLGDLPTGATVEDTYFGLSQLVSQLIQKEIIPVIIGGSQDLTYANYRAYDKNASMVNIVNVDKSFDLGDSSKPITNHSYLGKIILEQPYNLFNYSTLGYQTYFNSQEEIDLMEKLYFESYRLGGLTQSISAVEPVLRDADIVTLDMNAIKSSEVSENQKFSPNGFDGREICAISRYAGISNKVSSFGVYEYNPSTNDESTSILIAQILWYFVEGVQCRVKDDDFSDESAFNKYTVLVEEEELVFYKSNKTERWWIEIPFSEHTDNKLKQHSLLACMYEDYKEALDGNIPERWYKAFKKN
jgi:arginase family enzyme